MRLYDEIINDILTELSGQDVVKLPVGDAADPISRDWQDAGKAMFYWDYDVFYTRLPLEQKPPYTHEAGEFILRNLKLFPNQLPETSFDVLRKPKNVRFISASTENAQARYLPQWIRGNEKLRTPSSFKDTAVVLCNESLLLPVLHSIPAEVKNVNITMGFPLAQTPVYSFIHPLPARSSKCLRHSPGQPLLSPSLGAEAGRIS